MIAVIDYGMGNLHSVTQALKRLGADVRVVREGQQLTAANGVILPGVGAFGDAMVELQKSELDQAIQDVVAKGTPLLGICLGMQLLFTQSEEHGIHQGLDLLKGTVIRFEDGDYKIPHMGWNQLAFKRPDRLLSGIQPSHVYFVHSYRVLPADPQDLIAITDYHTPVTAIVGRDNVYGMQFHPEKSGQLGMKLLQNFVALCQPE